MSCIFCLNPFCNPDRPETTEHVFPEAIGGQLTIKRVCKPCNDRLGSTIDTTLTESFPVVAKRSQFGIPGKSGHVPNAFWHFLENPMLVSEPDQEIYFKPDAASGWPRLFLKPTLKERALGDVVIVDLTVDARDRARIPEILRRAAKRAGKSISDEQIAGAIKHGKVSTFDSPLIKSSGSIAMPDVRLGALKIVYELSWRWLGDQWLEDPIAAEMRRTLSLPQPVGDMALCGRVGQADEDEVLSLLSLPSSSHVALSGIVGQSAMIAVRVFDLVAASFVITNQLHRYDAAGSCQHGFFIEVDALARRSREWPCWIGMTRHCNWEKHLSTERAGRMREQMRILYPDSLSKAA